MRGIWLRLSLLGLFGTASMLLAPLERLASTELNPIVFRLLALVQPAILVLLAAALGAWAAPKVALDAPAVRAWANRRPVWAVIRDQLPAAALAGLAVGIILVGFWSLLARAELPAELFRFEIPLVTKLLYGGIVEELLFRWGGDVVPGLGGLAPSRTVGFGSSLVLLAWCSVCGPSFCSRAPAGASCAGSGAAFVAHCLGSRR